MKNTLPKEDSPSASYWENVEQSFTQQVQV